MKVYKAVSQNWQMLSISLFCSWIQTRKLHWIHLHPFSTQSCLFLLCNILSPFFFPSPTVTTLVQVLCHGSSQLVSLCSVFSSFQLLLSYCQIFSSKQFFLNKSLHHALCLEVAGFKPGGNVSVLRIYFP